MTSKMTVDLGKLDKIRKGLENGYIAKVGILGAKASAVHKTPSGTKTLSTGKTIRTLVEGTLTNAEIGVIQEFGSYSANIPARSFLRMPIETKKKEFIAFLGSKAALKKIGEGDMKGLFTLIGIKAEAIVQEAFASHGFGKWEPNSPETIKKKGSSSPLIDTVQLRRSISSTAVKK